MKNQFIHKGSQDGSNDLERNAADQLYNEQIPMTGIEEEAHILPPSAKSGLLAPWKTGQLQPSESDMKNVSYSRNSAEEIEVDPLIHRQLPRVVSTSPSTLQAPATNPFSRQTNDATMIQHHASPNQSAYQQIQPQNEEATYPLGTYNNPYLASHSTSDYGYQGKNLASNYGIPGPTQGSPNGYSYSTNQFGNPNLMDNAAFYTVPPGFAPQAAMRSRRRVRRINIKRIPIWIRIVIAAIVFLIVAGGSAFAYYEFTIGQSVADITGNSATHKVDGKNQVIQSNSINPLTTRTNILLLGSDTDGKYPTQGGNDPTTGHPLAQTVIIVTIDPKTNYVGMLSIPRDMQVTDITTGYTNEKLDQAFEYAWTGTSNKEKAAAAAGHMEDIIQQNYGIHIDHYAWVGLQGFTKVVDDIGGVDIDVTHPMFDDNYPDDTKGGANYGYTRVNIAPGPQHLTGAEALTYVRTRHADLGGDFGRTGRQQQLLAQIKEKLTKNDNLITKMTSIVNDLDGFMFTDLTLGTLSQFATVAKQIDINKVDHVSFTNNYSTTSTGNNTNVLPNCAAINTEIQKMFGTIGTCQPQYSSISAQKNTGLARAQTTITVTSFASNQIQDTSMKTGARVVSVSQSVVNSTSTFDNLLNLMLLTTSGSLNAMQG